MSAAADRRDPVDAASLRRALGGFPTGVTVVTAREGERVVAMTANSFASVSLDPPLVSWCAALASASHGAFAAADAYAVHVLGAEHNDLALRFAGKSGDKFAGIAHHPGRTGAPILAGIAPVFECRVWARYPGGDHTILVGEVVELVERVQDPLLFHSGVLRRMDRAKRRPDLPHDGFARSYLPYLLARASHVVSGEFHGELKRFGLGVPEWRVLACLSEAEGLGVVELAGMAIMKQPRITKILDRLARDGLIDRRPDRLDRRRALVHLTEAGRAKVAPALAAARAHEAALLAPLTGEERGVIKHALDLLIGRAGAPEAADP
ncbi:p-hydroxyphenylacetate 3-hydroxylase, reductase component [Methylobacterium crusticola]|uniref:p-hydroxyphenylacetate 3-hydroxylase, reductase component n=1 Tax=Methylobacterium crusticola TaxID=1697972 RepID=A0ABQ4R177_9HYPH|nr:flavin reductase [Methylobacterium crusticola]GJD51432.1 p-hydroxyphenylacetate 3-hydroxylase, reductase component [Methylobacterium crusticola]